MSQFIQFWDNFQWVLLGQWNQRPQASLSSDQEEEPIHHKLLQGRGFCYKPQGHASGMEVVT